ncbi:MAG: HDIG domain-containing protein [Candidatus Gastranaerophilales bacterium]|nr:HDIG domain-containing protein [Candidatus Gastranaerophilales bacterium]
MNIRDIFDKSLDFRSKLGGAAAFLIFATVIAFLLSSKFMSQDLLENGVGKKKIIAKKTIEVVDTQKTELLRRDIARKIKPIIIPIDSSRILNAFYALKENALKIKGDAASDKQSKYIEFYNIFDITDSNKKEAVVNFALNSNIHNLNAIFQSTEMVLNKYLKQGLQDGEIETYTNENAIREALGTNLSAAQVNAVSGILECVLLPNLVIDEYATDLARKNAKNLIKPYTVTFKKGDTILKPDEILTQVKRDALRKSGYSLLEINKSGVLGIFLFTLLCGGCLLFCIKHRGKKYDDPRYYSILGLLSILLILLCVIISSNNELSNYLMPIPAFTIIMAVFTNPSIAFLATIIIIALISSALFLEPQFITIFVFGTLASSYFVSKISYAKRQNLVTCGLLTGLTMSIFIIVIGIFEGQLTFLGFKENMAAALCALINGLFSGIFSLGLIPIFESTFKAVTPYGLIELADHNSPLLSKLYCKAPGTYYHSLMVANLCESAAEAIGADPILARVGAFYHDIGKLQKPFFFIENQSYFGVENPHNKLNPRLSKMVIISHTKDGVEIAKKNGLPQEIINFIQQHHGEALAGHFYNQAVQLEGKENVQQEQFRYSGPKPNMKETAILMLADAAESAVRSLKNPTAEEVENMINKIITERLNDGQLSDSPLTLKDIKLIAITFNKILRGMQHDRVKYQEGINELQDNNKIVIGQSEEEKLERKIQKKIDKMSETKENKKEENEDKGLD